MENDFLAGFRTLRWEQTGFRHEGQPIYIDRLTGAMAYEDHGERLVSLPPEAEDAIWDLGLLCAICDRLEGRCN